MLNELEDRINNGTQKSAEKTDQVSWHACGHSWQWRYCPRDGPSVRWRHRLSDYSVNGNIGDLQSFRAQGGCNVWGKHPFFEPEGEHSAQSGALDATLTGGKYISNASSSQGILYGLESHYVTVGKRVGGFVLQVAARVVSRHSLNVMAGHDDVYALLPSGYPSCSGAIRRKPPTLRPSATRSARFPDPGGQCDGRFRNQPYAE